MKVTKYEHACLVVEVDGKKLVIDPGTFAKSLPISGGVVAIVVTHVHADHFDPEKLRSLVRRNPKARLFGTAEVAAAAPDLQITAVSGGAAETVKPFKLAFFGELHAPIHDSIPRNQNVGVMVNDTLYYPGDSFTLPRIPVPALATPISGPWLRAGEMIDLLRALKPRRIFQTHDALLSEIGHGMMNNYLHAVGGEFGATVTSVQLGQSIEI